MEQLTQNLPPYLGVMNVHFWCNANMMGNVDSGSYDGHQANCPVAWKTTLRSPSRLTLAMGVFIGVLSASNIQLS